MTIIADSGSTKTEWITTNSNPTLFAKTKGINPVRDSEEEIRKIIRTELMPELYSQNSGFNPTNVKNIHFYGAGCIEPFSQSVGKSLALLFRNAQIYVYSDLLGAARALCGREEGIACILGTGSNSCYCNRGEIISHISPLGYILGDEGSGAVLGRLLLSEILKGNLKDLWEPFHREYNLTVTDIINKVYRQPQPNRFLASVVPFIQKNIQHCMLREMVVQEFVRFLKRNVVPYDRPDLPVNFVGGVATSFMDEIYLACQSCNLKKGKIIARPAEDIAKYHFYVI